MNNADLVSPWLCEASCFATNYTFSTVPYFSLDEPRSVTLVYNGDQAFRRPFIYADVNGDDGTGVGINTFTLSATVNGSAVTFLNGSTQVQYGGNLGWIRVAAQFDGSSLATNIYPMVVTVKATYDDGLVVTKTASTQLMVLNESGAPVAKGWTIAGVQRLYSAAAGGYLITNGDASGVRFTALGAKAADYSRLTYDNLSATYTRTYPDLSKAVFNSAGQQTKFIDPNGRTAILAYDGFGRVQQIGDPYRKQPNGSPTFIGLSYDGNGLRTIQEPGPDGTPWAGRTTSFLADGSRCLLYAQDPDGVSTNFSCDASGRLATVSDRRGGVTTFGYNSTTWKLSTVTLPQIPVDAGGGSTTLTNPVIHFTPWQGTYASYLNGIVGSVQDAGGRTTSFLVNRFGQATDMTDPSGLHTTITTFGILPTRITHPSGWTDTVMYDTLGRVTRNHPAGGSATDYQYSPANTLANTLTVVTGAGSRLDSISINAARQVTRVTLGGNPRQTLDYTYDGNTMKVRSVTDNAGHRTSYSYDSRFGNLSTDTIPGGRVTVRSFDRFGRDSVITPPGLASQTSLYDQLNRPTSTSANGTTITFGYDQLFQTDVYDANSNHYHTDYNALGWPTQQCDALSVCGTIRYDASGLVMSTTNRRGQLSSVTRDNLGRVTSRTGTGLVPNYYSYSTNGRDMVAWNSVSRDSVFTNPGTIGNPGTPATDSVVTWIDGKRYRIFHQYPNAISSKHVTTLSSNTGTTFSDRTAFYAASGFLDSLKIGSTKIPFVPDADGTGGTFSYPNFSRVSAALSTHQTWTGSFTNGLASTFNRFYHYDPAGRIDQMMVGNSLNSQQTFTYDALGRLIGQASRTGCSFVQQDSTSGRVFNCPNVLSSDAYAYDVMGNRTDRGSYIAGNRILSFNGVNHYYDLDGNVIQKYDAPTGYNRQYWWNAENQLDSAKKSGWYREKHDYNAFGKVVRTSYAEASNAFAVKRYLLWDGDALIADFTPNGQRESDYVYLPGTVDHPFAVTTGATTPATLRFNEVDELGNVLGTSEGGSLSQSNSYDPWGKVTISGNSDSHLFWKGLFWHGDVTGLIYMRNRWYDQETGRFVNEDPAGFAGGINLYSFAGNDPINGSDPYGLCIIPEEFFKTIAAAEEGQWSYNCTDLPPVVVGGNEPPLPDPLGGEAPVGDPSNHGPGGSRPAPKRFALPHISEECGNTLLELGGVAILDAVGASELFRTGKAAVKLFRVAHFTNTFRLSIPTALKAANNAAAMGGLAAFAGAFFKSWGAGMSFSYSAEWLGDLRHNIWGYVPITGFATGTAIYEAYRACR